MTILARLRVLGRNVKLLATVDLTLQEAEVAELKDEVARLINNVRAVLGKNRELSTQVQALQADDAQALADAQANAQSIDALNDELEAALNPVVNHPEVPAEPEGPVEAPVVNVPDAPASEAPATETPVENTPSVPAENEVAQPTPTTDVAPSSDGTTSTS